MATTEWATVAQIKSLQERITKEESRRKEADSGLGVQLNAEEGKRYAGDGVLTDRVAALEAKVAELSRPAPTPEPAPEPTPEPKPDIFTGKKISDFPVVIQAAPGRIRELSDPLGSGKTVLGLTVADSDIAPAGNEPTNNPRSQLQSPTVVKPGMEFYVGTSILFPSDFPSWGGWMTLLSVYGPPFGGSGPFHLASYGKTIDWEEFWQGPPLARGRWIPLLMHGLFDYNGWGEVEIDGKASPRINTAIRKGGVNDGGNNDVRVAQYRQKGTIPGTATLYFDGLRIGTTRASVGF